MRFLIVDDHAVVRKGIIEIVHDFVPDLELDEATTSAEAVRLAGSQRYDLVLLDISLPDESGQVTLKRLKESVPERPVLILSVHREDEYVVHAFRNGADGYLTKSSAPEELREAVTRILDGDVYISPTVAAALASAACGRSAPTQDTLSSLLSAREYEVLVRIAQGTPLVEIARLMNLSGKTVSTYKTRAMRKLNLSNQTELIRFAMRCGLSS